MSNIIDFNVIDGLKEIGDQEFLDELIGIFLSQSNDLIKEINDLTTQKDAQALSKAAHKLKGSCLNLGANAMGDICQKIELSTRDNNLSEIEPDVSELVRLHQETCSELEKLR